jgi:hypothetical protein
LAYKEIEIITGRSQSQTEVRCLDCGKYSAYYEDYDDPYAMGPGGFGM